MQTNVDSQKFDEFLQKIKSGDYEFSTRHQEDSWGIRYSKENGFEFWNENYQSGAVSQSYCSEWTIREKLAIYKVEDLIKGLIAVRNKKL